jgi:hypothetical protein
MTKPIKAWWFGTELKYGDGRKAEQGVTHTVYYKPICCKKGLHASISLWDALSYARGDFLWRVEISGDIDKNQDKIAGQSRKYLYGADMEHVFRKFACRCALDVLSDNAPQVVVDYLNTQDENIRDAAFGAARNAAMYAAMYTARDAARYAAMHAAMDAAGDATWHAQLPKYKRRLVAMANAEFKRLDMS